YNCAYCSKPIFGRTFRSMSAGRVVGEINYLREKLGVREIAFYDDVFTIDKKRIHEICEALLSGGVKIGWTCETRVNLVDKELLTHMKEAGCYSVAYGIESAAPEILGLLHKDITPEQVSGAVRLTQEAGLDTVGYFMLGSPGETPDTIEQTIRFARELGLDFAQFSLTTPFPGTELYELLGERKDSVAWESYIYSGGDSRMLPIFTSDGLSREDLKEWTRRAYREFYLRPTYVFQRLRKLRSWGDVKVNLNGLGMLRESTKAGK
ncbi:B12-binding domain-containing radical SAM protein, partial [Chloroflexota bacterium]